MELSEAGDTCITLCEEHRPPRYSPVFGWETLNPAIRLDASWHKPSTPIPLQVKFTPKGIGAP